MVNFDHSLPTPNPEPSKMRRVDVALPPVSDVTTDETDMGFNLYETVGV